MIAPLKPGDTVALLSASGPCTNRERVANAVQHLNIMGLNVQVMESCRAISGTYLAGPDSLRLNDLHQAFANKNIKGIIMARGGYGSGRLLPSLDYALISQNPKLFIGFSDVTALHIALNQMCNLGTFHGPMPYSCFGGDNINKLSALAYRDALFLPMYNPWDYCAGANLQTLHPGTSEGKLVGGNLTVIASTIGTPYEIDITDRILFLEDVGEDPYRIDRLLLQLKLANKFSKAAGVILGDFSPDGLLPLRMAITQHIMPAGIPIIGGIPAGHGDVNITLPLGKTVRIYATDTPYVEFNI